MAESIVHDPAQPVAFQARQGGPIYSLRVPLVADRAAFRHALAATGAKYWGQLELARSARDATLRLLAGMPEQSEWLSRIDGYSDGISAALALGANAPDAQKALGESLIVPPELALIFDALVKLDPLLAARVADNQVFEELAGLVAARMFVVGWEGDGLPALRRGVSGVAEECLALIQSRDMITIGRRVRELLEPRQDVLGNSASPSSGRSSRNSSRTGSTTRRKRRSPAGTATA